jgi:hypothetical protein
MDAGTRHATAYVTTVLNCGLMLGIWIPLAIPLPLGIWIPLHPWLFIQSQRKLTYLRTRNYLLEFLMNLHPRGHGARSPRSLGGLRQVRDKNLRLKRFAEQSDGSGTD